MSHADQARFEELLPWYANGSIGGEDGAFVEHYLAQHPEARTELDWYHSLAVRMQDNVPSVPATIGLAKTMTRIRGDAPTLSARIGSFMNSIFGSQGMRPAMAFGVILAVQVGFIFSLMQGKGDDAAELRALRATAVAEGPMLRINFTPEAKEADIRFLLLSVQGSLAGGPGQLGDYYVRVPAGKEDIFAAKIKAAPFVQAVTVAPGIPPRE